MNKTLDIGEYDIDALYIKASVYLHQKNKIKANGAVGLAKNI